MMAHPLMSMSVPPPQNASMDLPVVARNKRLLRPWKRVHVDWNLPPRRVKQELVGFVFTNLENRLYRKRSASVYCAVQSTS